MKKNLYYRTVFKRSNTLKEGFLSFFLAFCSWPRMLIEVFIRKNQGERYFSFSGALTLLIILTLLPLFSPFSQLYGSSFTSFLGIFLTWYLYLAGFLYMTIQRRNEIKRLPSVYDFGRFSLSTGYIHPQFRTLEFMGKPFSIRTIETLLEPGVFGVAGFVLWMSGQPIGFILLVSGIFYSFSYMAAYHQGDNFVMDKIDEMICNEELVKAFVEGRSPDETRGLNYYGRRPADPEARRRIAETFIEEETVVAL
jgi:uncharacterized membrane protein HdeD (DUF308 family)